MSKITLINAQQFKTDAVFRSRHLILDSYSFSDEYLIRVINNHPQNAWTISGMGTSPEAYTEWGTGDASNLDGEEILRAIKKGRLWLNIRRVSDYHSDLAAIVNQLYNELGQINPAFQARQYSGNILVSSPRAIVYMHIDATQNILWHLRGRKRIWVYPAGDNRFASQEDIEAIAANSRAEDLPYFKAMDKYAECHDLAPGNWIIWPQHSPHRVQNLDDLNVSLSTEHVTPEDIRKLRVYRSNYLLRTRLRFMASTTQMHGFKYLAKCAVNSSFFFLQKMGMCTPAQHEYPTTFRVDPDAPNGIIPLRK